MFCKWCGNYAFVRGGPISQHGCPDCKQSFFSGQEKVSRDDDPPGEDRSSSHDEDSSSEYRASPDEGSYSSNDSYSSSDSYSPSSSTSSSSDDGGGIVLVILLVVGLIIAYLLSEKHSAPQSVPVAMVQSPPVTPPQSPPVYLFQNTPSKSKLDVGCSYLSSSERHALECDRATLALVTREAQRIGYTVVMSDAAGYVPQPRTTGKDPNFPVEFEPRTWTNQKDPNFPVELK